MGDNKELANEGDLIEWDFKDSAHRDDPKFQGNFRAKVAMVDKTNEHYGVYASYGQDLITFERARIIERVPIEPMIPVSKAFEFAEWISMNEWYYVEEFKYWLNPFVNKSMVTSELYERYLSDPNK